MYHCLIMHVYQPLCDVFELSERIISGGRGLQSKILQARTDSHPYVS